MKTGQRVTTWATVPPCRLFEPWPCRLTPSQPGPGFRAAHRASFRVSTHTGINPFRHAVPAALRVMLMVTPRRPGQRAGVTSPAAQRRFLIDGGLATDRAPGRRILSPWFLIDGGSLSRAPSLWIARLLGTHHRLLGTGYRLLGTVLRLLGTGHACKPLIQNDFLAFSRSKTL